MTRWLTILVLLSFSVGGFIQTQSIAATPQMIDAAGKEKRVTYYTTMTVQEADQLLKAFEKKYPGIRTEVFRANKDKLLARLLAEDSSGRTIADVVSVNDVVMHLLRIKGILGNFDNPEASAYGPGFKDPDGYWVGLYGATAVIVYNTKMVKPENVPKRFEDLLDLKWKGKMGMDGSMWEWFAAQLQIMGYNKGLAFMKKLATQDLHYRTGPTLLMQLTVAGEFPLMVYGYAHGVEQLVRQGAPLAWVPVQPVFMNLVGTGPLAKAPHQNAARLFVEFLSSQEGQSIIANMHRVPVRPDVPSDPPKLTQGLKFFTLKPEIAEKYADYQKLFLQTFGLKR